MRHRSQPAIQVASRSADSVCPGLVDSRYSGSSSRWCRRTSVRFGFGVVVAEDDRDVDLAGAQQFQRLGWLRVGQADLQAGMPVGQRGHRPRDERADHGREAGQAYPPGAQPDVGGQFGVGGVDPPEDLGGPGGQQLPGGGEPDPAPGPLQQLRAGLGLEPGEVVADRRLRVVQLLRRRGDRSEPRERVDDTQSGDVQHVSTLSMSRMNIDIGRMSDPSHAQRHDSDTRPRPQLRHLARRLRHR